MSMTESRLEFGQPQLTPHMWAIQKTSHVDSNTDRMLPLTSDTISALEKASKMDAASIAKSLPSTYSDLDFLLKKQVQGAQCAARCSTLEGEEEGSRCREVCSRLIDNSSSKSSTSSQTSSICSSPLTCGEGCQQACKPPPPSEQSASLTSLTISASYSISWHFSSSQSAVFLVAGKDPGGKWHLIATTVKSSLAANTVAGFTDLRLLAVTSSGVADGRDFNLEDVKEEKKKQTEEEEKGGAGEEKEEGKEEKEEEKGEHYTFNFSLNLHSLSFLALPGCLAILLLFILLLIEMWCNVRRNKKETIHTLESVSIQKHKKDTKKEATQERVETKNELSNSLPTYVEATQSLDPVGVSKKKRSFKENDDFSNNLPKTGTVSPHSNKVPQFSKSLADSNGPVMPGASPVFSIVTIRWPTAVDNFYEDVENPYGLTRSNSFRLV